MARPAADTLCWEKLAADRWREIAFAPKTETMYGAMYAHDVCSILCRIICCDYDYDATWPDEFFIFVHLYSPKQTNRAMRSTVIELFFSASILFMIQKFAVPYSR